MIDDSPDLMQRVLLHLREKFPDTAIDDKLPPGRELDESRVYIVVDEMPGDDTRPWGGEGIGPILARHVLEITVHGPSAYATKDYRREIDIALAELPRVPASQVTRVNPLSTWHWQPDENPNMRCIGAEYAITVNNR